MYCRLNDIKDTLFPIGVDDDADVFGKAWRFALGACQSCR